MMHHPDFPCMQYKVRNFIGEMKQNAVRYGLCRMHDDSEFLGEIVCRAIKPTKRNTPYSFEWSQNGGAPINESTVIDLFETYGGFWPFR